MKLQRNKRYSETETKNLLAALRREGNVTLKDVSATDARTSVFFENFKIGDIVMKQFVFTVASKPYPQKIHKVLASL